MHDGMMILISTLRCKVLITNLLTALRAIQLIWMLSSDLERQALLVADHHNLEFHQNVSRD